MDSRLATHHGQRLVAVRRSDCPALALAIVGATRKLGVRVERTVFGTTPAVYLHGRGLSIIVRADDWVKVLPYLRDGTFNPQTSPLEPPEYLHPGIMLDLAVLNDTDKTFYTRVLGVLQTLFPEDYPTSNL